MGPLDQARALAGMSKTAESEDVSFVRRLLLLIEQHGIPAPSPIGTHPSHLTRLLLYCSLFLIKKQSASSTNSISFI